MRLLVVFNPVAGRRHHARWREVTERLAAAGHHIEAVATRGPGHAEHLAATATRERCDALLVAGGDGTVNEVLNGLGNAAPPLAIYPLGTANVLAAELGMPSHPAGFVRTFLAATPRPAWPGEIAGRRFALMAGIGFDARVVAAVSTRTKRLLGRTAYLAAAAAEWARLRPASYRVTIDGTDHEAAGVVIAKARYYGGRMSAAPDARITDPRLHVCLLQGGRRRDLGAYALALARGRLHLRPDVRIVTGTTVAIAAPAGEPVQVDGDIRVHLPAVARVAPSPVMLFMA